MERKSGQDLFDRSRCAKNFAQQMVAESVFAMIDFSPRFQECLYSPTEMSASRQTQGWLAAVALLSSIPVALAFRRYFGSNPLMGPSAQDPFLVLYVLQWGASAWKHLLSGFWNAPFFFPSHNSIAFSDHLLLPSALYGGIRSLGLGPAAAYDFLVVSSFGLTCTAIFLLLKRATRAASFLCALVSIAVVYAPWRWGHLTHLAMLWGPGTPLTLLTFDRLLRRKNTRSAMIFTSTFLITLLSGAYLLCFTLVAMATSAALRLSRPSFRRSMKPKAGLLAATAAVCFVGLGALFFHYRGVQALVQEARPDLEVRSYALKATDWLAPSGMASYARLVPQEWLRSEASLFPGFLLTLGTIAYVAISIGARRTRLLPPPLLARSTILGGLILLA
ncbi:MAG: hypothetical protein ABI639_16240, partial [Thermoanaerobaculia bacterium]